jgi:hypothetical protein
MHYDFGISLFDLGVWEIARMHMDTYGVQKLMRQASSSEEAFLSVMRLRVALDFPLVVDEKEQVEELWDAMGRRFVDFLRNGVPKPPIEELQDSVTTLPMLHYHSVGGGGKVGTEERLEILEDIQSVLRQSSPFLDRVAPHLEGGKRTGGKRIKIGIVSQSFCSHPVGRVTLPLISSLPRDKFRVNVFALPTIVDSWAQAISWSADGYHPLPMDFVEASNILADAKLDILLFPDHPDRCAERSVWVGGDRAKQGSGRATERSEGAGGGEGACATSPAAGGVRGVSPRQPPRLPAAALVLARAERPEGAGERANDRRQRAKRAQTK